MTVFGIKTNKKFKKTHPGEEQMKKKFVKTNFSYRQWYADKYGLDKGPLLMSLNTISSIWQPEN